MMVSNTEVDVLIIGAGPVGLFAAFECGMLGLKTIIVDALDFPGGQCSALYPQKPIYDIPGDPSILAQDLINQLLDQIAPFHPTFLMQHQVVGLQRKDKENPINEAAPLWEVTTQGQGSTSCHSGVSITAKAIIIAAGVGAFGPNRPPLENLQAFEGTSVFYSIPDIHIFAGKRVVIAGGGDSAIDWALVLKDIATKVYVVHRRPQFRAAPSTLSQLHQSALDQEIDLVTPFQLDSLEGSDGYLTAVIVRSMDQRQRRLEADILLPFFGLSMDLGPILEWGLELEKKHIQVNPGTCATNHEGIYAIGDIATYDHKLKLILSGFAEAAQAAHHIRHILHPHEVFHFEHSTTKGIPADH